MPGDYGLLIVNKLNSKNYTSIFPNITEILMV